MDEVRQLKGYELQERIGVGGFGAVYRARQSTIGREVAIKIILPRLANQPEFIRRFEGEAQLVARLEHPHITPLYDYWRDLDGAYLVMRWLRGGSLHDALRSGPFELRAAALLLDQVAGALSLAHRNGIIHRDIKPGNILLDEDGNAYLTDFGIAKDLNLADTGTQQEALVGSLDYISPEQARSEPVTPRTDIYSLGVTMYEVVVGEHPFTNVSSLERPYKHINDPLPRIVNLNDSVLDAVNRVIQKATAKNPERRYADAMSFAADFREAIGLNQIPTNVENLLTQREHEILHLIIAGKSNREIAQELTVALSTVKWYVNQIYSKLGVRSRVQAIVRARELHLLGGVEDTAAATLVPTDDFTPENPYKGLRAFQSADYADFFGREKITARLVQRLGDKNDAARFLAVVGPSGSGKSSLVKAGLIPSLWRGDLPGSEKWFVVEMLPGAHPLDELEIALIKVAAQHAGNIREQLDRDENGLARVAQLILPNDATELVVVIDQFEEVFTLVNSEPERQRFLDLLYMAVCAPHSRVRVVITLRADFYDRPLHYPQFGDLVRTRLETIMPLSADELERAITRPAARVGVSFEVGLAASIVADVNYQPGSLPLLQYALTELFERRQGRLLTREAYETIGKTVGALAKRAEAIYLELDAAQQDAAQQMFLRLATLGEGMEDTRRRAERSELMAIAADGEMMDEVVDTFAAYRLLTLDNDPMTRRPTVEVAHEALLREWERLRLWLDKSRDDIKIQRQLSAMAAEWEAAKQNVSYLARGARLEQLAKWAGETALALTPSERAYLEASIVQREAETKAEAERQAREKVLEERSVLFLRGLVAVLLAALLGAFGLTGVAVNQSNIAQSNAIIAERNAAEARNVALVAGSQAALANGSSDMAITLALQAVTLDPSSARAQLALSAAAYTPGTMRVFEGHNDWVDSVALSPDGRTALSASWDGNVILWDISTGEIVRRFEGHRDLATSVAFTPDGRSVISTLVSPEGGTLIQWDLQTGDVIRRFAELPIPVWALAVSPDGRYVASGSAENTVTLWDIQTGELIRQFEGHTDEIEAIEFSADGSQFLTASDDWTIILWDIGTGQKIRQFEGHNGAVYSAVFSPDRRMILSGSGDGKLILWDIETGEMMSRFNEPGATAVKDVAFSPDGRAMLSAGVAGLTLWDIETGQPITPLQGHSGVVNGVVFGIDGRTALSASGDSTLRLWDLENGQLIRRFDTRGQEWLALATSPDGRRALASLRSDTGSDVILWDVNTGEEVRRYSTDKEIIAIAFAPDGQTALVGTDNDWSTPNDLILWDANIGEVIHHFNGHRVGIPAVAFNPDGRTAVSADWLGTMILWDVATGQEIRRFEGYEGNSWLYVEFSPDGQTLAATYQDNLIVLWDVATGQEIHHFEGHAERSLNFTFSRDGQRALSGSDDGTIILWDVATGAILHRFTEPGPVPQVDISADGRFGIAGGFLWDLNTGNAIRSYNASSYSLHFAPDNHTVLSGELPDRIELWRIDMTLDELLTWTRANRYIPELTCDQRELYHLEPMCDAESS